MSTLIQRRVEMARAGTNPTVIARVASGWMVLGDPQFLRAWSLLLSDSVVPDLNALNKQERIHFLLDMTILGDALLDVTAAFRIKYEILGNSEPALHAHVIPRYLTEPEPFRRGPIWSYPEAELFSVPLDYERDKELIRQVAEAAKRRMSPL